MFSIGVILFELLFIKLPFSVRSEKDFLDAVTNESIF